MQAAGLDLQTMSSLSSSGSMLFDMQDTWDLERRAPYFLRTPTKRVKRCTPLTTHLSSVPCCMPLPCSPQAMHPTSQAANRES